MNKRSKILEFAQKNRGLIKTIDVASHLGLSRQQAHILISNLVFTGHLIKVGSTKSAQYILASQANKYPDLFPGKFLKTFENKDLEEHKVIDEIESRLPTIMRLPENTKSIFVYAFSEMFNNAIEHSKSKKIAVEVSLQKGQILFTVDDFGVGVFRNIMQKKNLRSELEAVQDLLKGKTTTMPRSHSGEGIFFTSRVGDEFILESYGYRLIVDNSQKDVFLQEVKGKGNRKHGTKVTFRIALQSKTHLNEVFGRYANIDNESDYGFDRTEIQIKLYTLGGVHISRSQARRVLSGLEKFRVIVFDFDKVPMIGQSFADEIFRVFHKKYPDIKLQTINMNDAVQFMVNRVETDV